MIDDRNITAQFLGFLGYALVLAGSALVIFGYFLRDARGILRRERAKDD